MGPVKAGRGGKGGRERGREGVEGKGGREEGRGRGLVDNCYIESAFGNRFGATQVDPGLISEHETHVKNQPLKCSGRPELAPNLFPNALIKKFTFSSIRAYFQTLANTVN